MVYCLFVLSVACQTHPLLFGVELIVAPSVPVYARRCVGLAESASCSC